MPDTQNSFNEIDSFVSKFPVDRLFIYNGSQEIEGLCIIKNAAGSLKKSLLQTVGAAGYICIPPRLTDPVEGKLLEGAFHGQEVLGGQFLVNDGNSTEDLLKQEIASADRNGMPCSLLLAELEIYFKGTRSGADVVSESISLYSECFENALEPNEIWGIHRAPLMVEGCIKKSFTLRVCFFIIMSGTGSNKARKRFLTLKKKVESLVDILPSEGRLESFKAGLGVYINGDNISAHELLKETENKLAESDKNGFLLVFTSSVRGSCQVTIEERTQLFGFLRKG